MTLREPNRGKRVNTSVGVDPLVLTRLDEIAASERRHRSEIIRFALDEYIERYQPREVRDGG